MGVTPKHSTLLTVYVVFPGGIRAEAVIDTAASRPVVCPKLGKKLGILQRISAARILQADGGTLKGGKQVVNTSFKFLRSSKSCSPTVPINELTDFEFNAEVLEMGPREMILGLSWLEENDFHIDTHGRKLYRHEGDLQIQCRERLIPLIKECTWFEQGEIIMILDIADRYKDYAAL